MDNENIKKSIKANIQKLIEFGSINEAKSLFKEYKSLVNDDIEVYSIEAIIAIIEKDFLKAENLLKYGLEKEPYNEDLLFNMSYLMDINKKDEKALEYFCKAKLFNPKSNIKVEDIICNFKIKNNNKLRVIHGTMEIANQMHTIAEGLKNIGVDTKTLNYYPNYLRYKADYTFDINSFKNIVEANIQTKNIASEMISKNDVFHFHFGSTLTLDHSDLPILKELNKKVVMHHWGSDVRLYSKAKKLNPYAIAKNMDEDSIKRDLEILSKYILDCIIADYELYEYVKDYYKNIHTIRQAIDIKEYKPVINKRKDRILIVHAPTSPEFKGTKYILSAIENLKLKYDFDFKLVQGMTHNEAKKIYESADLIIDQLLAGAYGLFAIEAMALGKPVISWITEYMKDNYPKELPIISANPDNIEQKIEYVIKNRDMLEVLGMEGRKYVLKYHDMNKICEQILKLYQTI